MKNPILALETHFGVVSKNTRNHTPSRFSITAAQLMGMLVLSSVHSAGADVSDSIPAPPPEVREQLGRMGVAISGAIPELATPMPISRSLAAKELARQCAWPEDGISIDPRAAVIQLAWAPAGALFGATVGTILGVSSKKLEGAKTVVAQVRMEFKSGDRLVAQLRKTTTENTGRRLALLPGPFPDNGKPSVTWAAFSGNPSLASAHPGPTDSELAGVSVSQPKPAPDTMLEISVLSQRLITASGNPRWHIEVNGRDITPPLHAINPRLSLEVVWHVRLIRVHDGAELYSIYPRYDGGCQKLAKWTAHHGRALRDELEHANRELSERIMEKLSRKSEGESLAMN